MVLSSRIAVVIPCRNEESAIRKCLDSMLQNDYPHELMDIVIIDGESTDRTREVVQEFADRYPCVRWLPNPQRTTPKGINIGIRDVANADYVMLASAHCTYARDYFSKLVEGSNKYDADLIGGFRDNHIPEGLWSSTLSLAVGHSFVGGDAAYRTDSRRDRVREVETVFGGCYRKDVFDRFGYFNENLIRAQDREFNTRISRGGGKVIYDPSIRCTYLARGGLRDYVRWTFRGAYWLFYGGLVTKTSMWSHRNYVPVMFLLYHLLLAMAAFLPAIAFAVVAGPWMLYAGLLGFFSMQAAWRHRRLGYLATFPLVFAATHFSYGLGTLCGLAAGIFSLTQESRSASTAAPEKADSSVHVKAAG